MLDTGGDTKKSKYSEDYDEDGNDADFGGHIGGLEFNRSPREYCMAPHPGRAMENFKNN